MSDGTGLAYVESEDGTPLAFESIGDGLAIVLIGGALSGRASSARLAEVLARRFTVVTYDRRGRGESGDTLPYAVEREIEDLAAVISAAGGSALVYGHSSGGILALRAAAAGVRITRLCVYEPPLLPRQRAQSKLERDLRDLIAAGRDADAVEYFLLEATGTPPEAVAVTKAGPQWATLEALAPTILYDMAVSGLDDGVEAPDLGRVTVPLLALDGGMSPASVRATTAAVARGVVGGRHATIPDQRHNPSTEALAPVLDGFFSTADH